MATIVRAEDLDLSSKNSTAVISDAQKFVIPVAALGESGEPLVYPEGHEKAGKPIQNSKGKPIGDKGIVFESGVEGKESIGAVAGDGNGVVIINQVSEKQATRLQEKIQSVVRGDSDKMVVLARQDVAERGGIPVTDNIVRKYDSRTVNDLSVSELKEILAFARTTLGLTDIYNSSKHYIAGEMSPSGQDTGIEAYGAYKRNDESVCQACYVPGQDIKLIGPIGAAGGEQDFTDGVVVVKHGDKIRGIDPAVFKDTYKHPNGDRLEIDELAVQTLVPSEQGQAGSQDVTEGQSTQQDRTK